MRILYAAQIGVAPPSFVFFTNVATTFHFSYERFLINQLREQFGFVGTPIRIQVRRRDRKVAGQRTASKNQQSDARTQKPDVRRQKADVRSRKSEGKGRMAKSQRQRSDRQERAGRKDRHGRRRPQK